MPLIIELLSSHHPVCREQAAYALANLAKSEDETILKELIPAVGIIVALMGTAAEAFQEQMLRTLVHLARRASARPTLISESTIPLFLEMLKHADNAVCNELGAAGLASLSADDGAAEAIVSEGGIIPLVDQLKGNSRPTVDHVVVALSLLAKRKRCRDAMLAEGVMLPMVQLLVTGNKAIKQNVARTLGTISSDDGRGMNFTVNFF